MTIEADDRLVDPSEMLAICSSLITIIGRDQHQTVALAHYSVKKLLVFERIMAEPARFYGLSNPSANRTVAEANITYQIIFKSLENDEDVSGEFPYARYSQEF
jgi:hypothetical protein